MDCKHFCSSSFEVYFLDSDFLLYKRVHQTDWKGFNTL